MDATVLDVLHLCNKIEVAIADKGRRELQAHHEEYTWVDVPSDEMDPPVHMNRRESPRMIYGARPIRTEAGN